MSPKPLKTVTIRNSTAEFLNRKVTESQALPLGWRQVRLGDIVGSEITIEKGRPTRKTEVCSGNIPVIAGGKTSPYSHNAPTHTMPCITISSSGAYAGYVWYHTSPIWASDCNVIYSTHHLTEYLYYALKANQERIYSLQSRGGQPHIYAKDIKNLKLSLPPLSEQKSIASLLEKWDTAIEKTESLITTKKKRFKWLLKILISDQQRKPGWQKVKLGEVGIISSAGVDKKIIDEEHPVRLVNYLNVLKKDFIFSDDLDHWVTAPERKMTQCDVRKGDIFFTPSSEIQGDIAHSAVSMENIDKAVYSYHIIRFRLKEKWDTTFRGYIFKSSHFYEQAHRLCQGSGQRYVISQKFFREMTVYVPSITEQRRIAQILSTAQHELAVLKKLAEKCRTQKHGLMQKLLTGKWRVIQ